MTAKKDLKRRIRERQGKTGESYTTARAHVLAQRDEPAALLPAIPVIELIDVTEQARALGLRCLALASPMLVERVPAERVLARVRDALLATERDPQMDVLRAVMLRGEVLERDPRRRPGGWWEDTRAFFARARVGIGGTNRAGDMLALQVDAEMVIVHAGYVPHMPPIPRTRSRRVYLSTADSFGLDDETLIVPR